MAHKTLIDGTAYDIKGGKTLIDGTGYSIKGGKTLVEGTGYGISFGVTWKKYNTVATYTYTQKHDGTSTSDINESISTSTKRVYTGFSFSASSGFSGTGGSYVNVNSLTDRYDVNTTTVYQYQGIEYTSGSSYVWRKRRMKYATKSVSGYKKGTTSYGEVEAEEGAVPDGGTLYSGSVTGTYCIVNVGGTYYYYERA